MTTQFIVVFHLELKQNISGINKVLGYSEPKFPLTGETVAGRQQMLLRSRVLEIRFKGRLGPVLPVAILNGPSKPVGPYVPCVAGHRGS